MSKFTAVIAGLIAAVSLPGAAGAVVLGPHADACVAGRPAMLVRIQGLKARTGIIRVQTYGGDPAHYFDKGSYIGDFEVRTPATGPVEVCMPVAHAGIYAISVRHDANGNGSVDIGNDGGGFSGNPSVSMFDALFKRKPSPVQVQVRVAGLTQVPIIINYVHGTSVGPIGGAQ